MDCTYFQGAHLLQRNSIPSQAPKEVKPLQNKAYEGSYTWIEHILKVHAVFNQFQFFNSQR